MDQYLDGDGREAIGEMESETHAHISRYFKYELLTSLFLISLSLFSNRRQLQCHWGGVSFYPL